MVARGAGTLAAALRSRLTHSTDIAPQAWGQRVGGGAAPIGDRRLYTHRGVRSTSFVYKRRAA
eukprot:6900428-Prymnesium_polylepis.1